ncbi:acyl transferase domain-containing protein [Yoonia maritima]|uniref:Acyl transferase domain-containing protein n=1 Tax=Yoonia maritima TaxID=1435347 RepID=A0A2T0VTS5_9RHOB|nr:type I polyketide synthase [Yoonia maritima]PRY74629.1 acyl transferase domain-containing protein [Yoonia maritima]
MQKFKLLTNLFCQADPDLATRDCLVFLNARGAETDRYSYAQLRVWTQRLAQTFIEHGLIRREPVAMIITQQARFTLCFAGLMLAGAVPAPLAGITPRAEHASVKRLLRILHADAIKTLVVESEQHGQIQQLLAQSGLEDVKVLALDDLMAQPPQQAFDLTSHPAPDPSDVAYVQYTSGSTARPKGVALSHENVLANLAFMDRIFEQTGTVRMSCWLPLHHDMGLVGNLLKVLYGQGFGVFMPPNALMYNPALWFQTIHDNRVNTVATPDFALGLCADRVDPDPGWDLSCLTQIFVGAEPVKLGTLNTFADRFHACGLAASALRPVYGMAEASLLVAGGAQDLTQVRDHILQRPLGGGDHTRDLLPYAVHDGITVAIRDPLTQDLCPDDTIGEIYLTGDSLARNYLDGSALAPTDAGMPTGDLGLLHDGRLYITGRKKDVVIVRGLTLPAEDIETLLQQTLGKVLGGLPSVAISRHFGDDEQLYLFQEAPRSATGADLASLRKQISATLIEHYGWAPAQIVFVPAKFLPRTTSNKIARALCMEQYLAGTLKTLSPRAPETPITTVPSVTPVDPDDPIVIVGMACNFPGAASIDTFWENLCNGVDSITEVPPSRWDNDLWYDPRPGIPGKTNTKWGGFVDELDLFDADLFGMSAIEARETDPQHRMLLETSWRLLEYMGHKKSDLARSNTGVYVGISGADYLHAKISLTSGLTSHNAYTGLGNAHCIAANRLSYFYDLNGPSMSVDTACSSSLTAFNLAVQSMRQGECDQAIVAGVNTMFTPGSTTVLSQFGMMSPDGRCKTFDASANGYVRSEGCGMVMIKRKSAALAAGDRILAQVCAVVSAQDGAGSDPGGGITFPNGAAQQALIARALDQSGLSGAEITYVESHGTGTTAGDPIEVAQIKHHYGQINPDGPKRCWMGGVKANIGHLESAAGIAGLIKTVLVLQHKQIPPQIHIQALNPNINLSDTRLAIPNALESWDLPDGTPYLAAVSSFGFGGALAHVILSEPDIQPHNAPQNPDMPGFKTYPLAVTANSHDGLRATLATVSGWLKDRPGLPLSDISHSFAKGRTPLKHRAAVVAVQGQDAAAQFDELLAQDTWDTAADHSQLPCYLFSGQGELYAQMGKDFYQRYPVFRAAFDECAAVIDPLEPGFDLAEYAFADRDQHIDKDRYNLPILFANQHALTTLFHACGLTPSYVLGHSMGEFAAASAAGALSPQDAIWLLYHRSRLMEDVVEPGAMFVANAPPEQVNALLDPDLGQIAAYNGPNRLTVSGQMTHINQVHAALAEQGVKTRHLNTNFAFHSPLVRPVLDAYRSFLDQVTFHPPKLPWISSVTADFVTTTPDADHWINQLSQPVLYDQSLDHLRLQSVDFVEIGPGGACLALALACLGKRDAHHMRTMLYAEPSRKEDGFFIDMLKNLYLRGLDLDWSGVMGGHFYPEKLPPMVMDRKRHWLKVISPETFVKFNDGSLHHTDDPVPFAAPDRVEPNPAKPEPDITSQEGWHYTTSWTPTPAPPDTDFADRAMRWMVVGANTPLTAALCHQIKARGDGCYWIEHGTDKAVGRGKSAQNSTKPDAHITLSDATNRDQWRQAIWDIAHRWSTQEPIPWKILFVCPDTDLVDNDLDGLNAYQSGSFTSLIEMLRELKEQVFFCPVWLVTPNTQAVQDQGTVSPMAAPIWGFGKTLFMEQPDIRGGMIDYDRADDPVGTADHILRKAVTPEFEPFVAVRDGRMYVQQITPAPLPAQTRADFRPDGVFIVTGGLGGLGLATARWLADKGARHIALLSRRDMPPNTAWGSLGQDDPFYAASRTISDLRAQGIQIDTHAVDLRDAASVTALFDNFDAAEIPIRGVLHAAGENWFDRVQDIDISALIDTLKTKVQASWHLHNLTKDRDLDCFVLFSTVSALWGSAKLSHYTAGNHFLDALANLRAAQSLPVTNVNWGPWDDVGMSAKDSEKPTLQKLGFYLMPVPDALTAMETAMAQNRHSSMICAVNWQTYAPIIKFATQPSFFAPIDHGDHRKLTTAPKRLKSLRALDRDVALDAIGRVIRKELQSVTLLDDTDELKGDMRFNIMGMDSLMTMTFAANLENYFQCEFPTTLAYNYPTIDTLGTFIYDVIHQAAPDKVTPDTEDLTPWLRPLNRSVVDVPKLVCLPFAGSGASAYAELAAKLDGTRDVIALQLPGREDLADMTLWSNLQDVVAKIAQDLEAIQGPYTLFGHSMGAILAYELTAYLQHAGQRMPQLLILSGADCPIPNTDARAVHLLEDDVFIDTVLDSYGSGDTDDERRQAVTRIKDLLRADLTLLETSEASDIKLTCPVAAIHATDDTLTTRDGMAAWAKLCKDAFFLQTLTGGHQKIIDSTDTALGAITKAEHLVL